MNVSSGGNSRFASAILKPSERSVRTTPAISTDSDNTDQDNSPASDQALEAIREWRRGNTPPPLRQHQQQHQQGVVYPGMSLRHSNSRDHVVYVDQLERQQVRPITHHHSHLRLPHRVLLHPGRRRRLHRRALCDAWPRPSSSVPLSRRVPPPTPPAARGSSARRRAARSARWSARAARARAPTRAFPATPRPAARWFRAWARCRSLRLPAATSAGQPRATAAAARRPSARTRPTSTRTPSSTRTRARSARCPRTTPTTTPAAAAPPGAPRPALLRPSCTSRPHPRHSSGRGLSVPRRRHTLGTPHLTAAPRATPR